MNLDRLNDWLTLLTNVGVLVGIFLLVIELRQNQEILELDQSGSRKSRVDSPSYS